MAKRIKRVGHTDWVIRTYFDQSQDSARANRGQVFFEASDNVLYSYGRHFPVARLAEGVNGEKAWVVTPATYSVTTNGHVRDALHRARQTGLRVFKALPQSHQDAMRDYHFRANELVEDAARSNTRCGELEQQAFVLFHTANEYAAFFGLEPVAVPNVGELVHAKVCQLSEARAAKAKATRAANAGKLLGPHVLEPFIHLERAS